MSLPSDPDSQRNTAESSATSDGDEAGNVAFELMKARLDRQTARIAEMRSNSSVLLAATALIASFLGKASIDRAGLNAANWCALAFLIAGVVVGIRPLWPVRTFEHRTKTQRVVELFGDRFAELTGVRLIWRADLSVAEVQALAEQDPARIRMSAAEVLEGRARTNGTIIGRRVWWVMCASLLLLAQVAAWTVGLAGPAK
jgi:hypothetical protein